MEPDPHPRRGVRALVTTAGLIAGSDTERLGNEFHGRIGMFPLN